MACTEKNHLKTNFELTSDNLEHLADDWTNIPNIAADMHSDPNSAGAEQSRVAVVDSSNKILLLKHILEKDIKAADLKWSFFVAACNTYRSDTCLRPFPPMYIKNESKDIEQLRRTIEVVPPLPVILQQLNEPDVYGSCAFVIDLLYWVLVQFKDLHIKSVSKEGFNAILRKIPSEMKVTAPNLIFQIASAKQSLSESRWRTTAQGHSTFFAYHGSRLENFHSIIHCGLQHTMSTNTYFGKGIYFSSELGVSLLYSSVGYGWGGSILGSKLSCVALCELINHPGVKRGDSNDDSRNRTVDSETKVPNKYYVAVNSDLVRIRYLLVYSQDLHNSRDSNGTGMLSWFRRHKLLTFMLGYVVLLASVGLTHNKNVEKYFKMLIQKVGLE